MPRVPLLRSISSSRTVIHVLRYTTRVLNCRIVMADFRKTVSHARQGSGCDLGLWHHGRVAITADIAVVGLGAVGSAAIYQAAKLGARVVGIAGFSRPTTRAPHTAKRASPARRLAKVASSCRLCCARTKFGKSWKPPPDAIL